MAHHIRCPRLQLLLPSCQLTITLVLFKCNTAMSLGKADFFSRPWERTMVDQNQSCNVALWMGHSFNRRRQWHPTPVLLPGKSHGWRSLVGCSPWDREESDTTEQFHFDFTFMHWRRKWQPTPVFLPGESQGRGSMVGCRLWGRTESDTTEATQSKQKQL